MKLVTVKCPSCGEQLSVSADNEQASCEFCGTTFPISDETHRAKHADAEQAGYEFEQGRIRAQEEKEAKERQRQESKAMRELAYMRWEEKQQAAAQKRQEEEKQQRKDEKKRLLGGYLQLRLALLAFFVVFLLIFSCARQSVEGNMENSTAMTAEQQTAEMMSGAEDYNIIGHMHISRPSNWTLEKAGTNDVNAKMGNYGYASFHCIPRNTTDPSREDYLGPLVPCEEIMKVVLENFKNYSPSDYSLGTRFHIGDCYCCRNAASMEINGKHYDGNLEIIISGEDIYIAVVLIDRSYGVDKQEAMVSAILDSITIEGAQAPAWPISG